MWKILLFNYLIVTNTWAFESSKIDHSNLYDNLKSRVIILNRKIILFLLSFIFFYQKN